MKYLLFRNDSANICYKGEIPYKIEAVKANIINIIRRKLHFRILYGILFRLIIVNFIFAGMKKAKLSTEAGWLGKTSNTPFSERMT